MLRRLSQLVPILAIISLAACAHKPVNYDVQLGQGERAEDGKLKAGAAEVVRTGEKVAPGYHAGVGVDEGVKVGRAMGIIEHKRFDKKTGKYKVINREVSWNVKTTAGIDFVFAQAYGTSAQTNGLNYIALSNDSLTETSASTTLSTEITANGLGRAQGTYAHTAGQSTATISKTFTCATAPQAAQKAALVSASSNGTVTHILAFTQRSLQVGDQLTITFTITISALELDLPYKYAANDNGWPVVFGWVQETQEFNLAA